MWFKLELDIFRSPSWPFVFERNCLVIQQMLQIALNMHERGSTASTCVKHKIVRGTSRCVISHAIEMMLSHTIQQQQRRWQQQHKSAIPPLQHPSALFGAKTSERFQNTRQIKTTPPVYHMQSCKKEMDMGRKRNKIKTGTLCKITHSALLNQCNWPEGEFRLLSIISSN